MALSDRTEKEIKNSIYFNFFFALNKKYSEEKKANLKFLKLCYRDSS